MERIVNAVVNTLAKELGSKLENAYLYGSLAQRTYEMGESDINLLLVVAEDLDIHELRNHFLPLWQEYGRRLLRGPLLTTRRTLARHLLLNPVLSDHLASEGKPLINSDSVLTSLPAKPMLNPHDTYAYLAQETLLASAALAPSLCPPKEQAANKRRLRSLARRIFGEGIDPQETAVTTFARIQQHLIPIINNLPDHQPWQSSRMATSPMLPGLQATYTKDLEKIILVFNQITAQQITSIGWERLATRLAKEYTGLYVTTPTQLRLINEIETPLDLFFKRNKRTWGEDPLANLPTSPYHKLRQAARRPSGILIDTLPHVYLTSPEEDLNKIIHDFQNKLLNVQLESELLGRMSLLDLARPPTPLPGREAPTKVRVGAILNHLDWWADHCTKAANQATTATQSGE